MKWLFITLVALNLIVFSGMVAKKITHPNGARNQPIVVSQPAPQQPQIIINTGTGTPTVATNGSVSTNGIPAGSTIGKFIGKTANLAVRAKTAPTLPKTNGIANSKNANAGTNVADNQPHAQYRACSAHVSMPEDDYHRIKGLLGRFPHAATRKVVQGTGEGDSQTTARMDVLFMSVTDAEAGEIQGIVGRYGSLNRTPCNK